MDDNFGFFGTEAFAASGYKNFGPLVGPENVKSDDYFATTADSSYLWAYGCGGGWYQGAGGIGSTGDFANSNLKSVFSLLFGSYFGAPGARDARTARAHSRPVGRESSRCEDRKQTHAGCLRFARPIGQVDARAA